MHVSISECFDNLRRVCVCVWLLTVFKILFNGTFWLIESNVKVDRFGKIVKVKYTQRIEQNKKKMSRTQQKCICISAFCVFYGCLFHLVRFCNPLKFLAMLYSWRAVLFALHHSCVCVIDSFAYFCTKTDQTIDMLLCCTQQFWFTVIFYQNEINNKLQFWYTMRHIAYTFHSNIDLTRTVHTLNV